jgi:hypothetical protein
MGYAREQLSKSKQLREYPTGSANMNIASSELSKVKDQTEYENVRHGSALYACVPQHLQMH